MKVLYICNYYDGTGWAQQGVASILALDSAGVDVVPRAIKLNQYIAQVPNKIKELESKSDKGCDIVIQNVLPIFAKYGNFKKNIIYYQTETSNFNNIGWNNEINLMDEAWVFCKYGKQAAINSKVKVPINIVPMPIDLDKFKKQYNNNMFNIRDKLGDAFVFYTISEFTKRKNIETLLRAFHSEFTPDEHVYLLIKTTETPHGANINQYINSTTERIKKELKLHKNLESYKKEMIICGNLPDNDLYGIHSTCDAFVTASHGEGWCLPCFDAMGLGKTIVAPKHTSFVDYLNDKNSYLVESYEDNCYGATDTLSELYSARENWFEVPVINLRRGMRNAYENRNSAGKKKTEQAKLDIQKYSYRNVGNIMKGLINVL